MKLIIVCQISIYYQLNLSEDIYTHMEFCDLYDKHLFLDLNIDYVSIVCMAKCLAYHSWPTMLHGIII